MAIITLHGDLERFASKPFELEADTFSELMSGMLTQIKGLRERLRKGYYKLKIGDKHYNTDEIKNNPLVQLTDKDEVHITPVIMGAGKNMNVFNIVIGVVLIAASWYAGGAAGWGYLGATGYATATSAFVLGSTMLLTGVIGLLTKPPGLDNKVNEGDKQRSSAFSNLKNLTPQGRPLPLLYGKMMTSLILISQGVETFDDPDFARALKDEEERKKNNKPKGNSSQSGSGGYDYDVGKDSRDEQDSNNGKSESNEPDRYSPDTYDDPEPERYSPDSYDDGDHGSNSDSGGSDSDDENSEGR